MIFGLQVVPTAALMFTPKFGGHHSSSQFQGRYLQEDNDEQSTTGPTGKKKAIQNLQGKKDKDNSVQLSCINSRPEELIFDETLQLYIPEAHQTDPTNHSTANGNSYSSSSSKNQHSGGSCECLQQEYQQYLEREQVDNSSMAGIAPPPPFFYCPAPAPVCIYQLTDSYDAFCLSNNLDHQVLYLLPFSLFLFLFLSILCFVSPKGKHSRSYARKVVCCWSHTQYQEKLKQELQQTLQHIRHRQQRMRQRQPHRVYLPTSTDMTVASLYQSILITMMNDVNSNGNNINDDANSSGGTNIPQPRQRLVYLKTFLFSPMSKDMDPEKQSNHAKDIEDTTTTCAICLCHLEEGDRVGDIPCRHIFHVDCLKEWIQRKNHCPLCSTSGDVLATSGSSKRKERTETTCTFVSSNPSTSSTDDN